MRYFLALLALVHFSSCDVQRMRPGSPLISAVREGRTSDIQERIRMGDNPNATAGLNNWTPLMHAVHKKQHRSVVALLEGGSDVNRGAPTGETPLMMATGYGYTDIVTTLLVRGANPKIKDIAGLTALDYAITGVSDIDRFTFGACQKESLRVLLAAAPDVKPSSETATRVTGCGEILASR